MVWRLVSMGFTLLLVSPAAAGMLADLVPEENGAAACWQRTYEIGHLAAHPDQQVTAMTMGISYATHDDAASGMHAFGLDVTLRDGRRGAASGPCWEDDSGQVMCGVECDGGGLTLALNPDGSVLVDLETMGYLRIESECSGGEAAAFDLVPGLDDKRFLLHQARVKQCKGLLPE